MGQNLVESEGHKSKKKKKGKLEVEKDAKEFKKAKKKSKVVDTGDGDLMVAFEEASTGGEENLNVRRNCLEGSVVSLEGVKENEKKHMKNKKKKEGVDRKSSSADTGGDDKGGRSERRGDFLVENGREDSVIFSEERKEKKKRHKEKKKEGVDRQSSLAADNKIGELVTGDKHSKNGGDIARMDSEEETVKRSKKRKRERESDTKMKSEVNMEEEERNADQMLEDNEVDELAEAQEGTEGGDTAEMNNDEEAKSKKKKKRKRENARGNVEEKIETENETCKKSTDAKEANGANKGKKKAKSDKLSYKDDSNKDKKKAKADEQVSDGKSQKGMSRTKKDAGTADTVENPTPGGTSKRVSFSDHVEVFPSSDDPSKISNVSEDGLVHGKRFTKEEDETVKESVSSYIESHNLGDEGLEMVLNCKKHPEIKNCWKEIGASLPWRPFKAVYYRAHVLFQRSENRKWTDEEVEFVRDFVKKHGRDWKKLGDELGKHRMQCKDTWRRIKLPNLSKGRWSQEEYQNLFDLVNMDLRMRASEERKSKHGMLRDNVCWQAISDKLSTRNVGSCCLKWYQQLSSPLVAQKLWADVDDYRMLDALSHLDAVCMEDVDWDNLLQHRPGDICRKRWNQMIRHIGDFGYKSFSEQVEVLAKRYAPDALQARELFESKPIVP
ncbi:hypothetical protein UlMin_028929 [Ulmus minor]